MLSQQCKLTKVTEVWYLNGVKWGGNKLCIIISVKNYTHQLAVVQAHQSMNVLFTNSCYILYEFQYHCQGFTCFTSLLPLLLLFPSGRQKEKWDKLKKKIRQLLQAVLLASVYTAWPSLCDVLPVSPPSVCSHDLVTDTGWWSIFYQTKLHSVSTDSDAAESPHPHPHHHLLYTSIITWHFQKVGIDHF